jgi:hypothetical protein
MSLVGLKGTMKDLWVLNFGPTSDLWARWPVSLLRTNEKQISIINVMFQTVCMIVMQLDA